MTEEKKNLLKGTRCYLIGPMEYLDGQQWRNRIKEELGDRNITFFDPYIKPFIHDIPEDNDARGEMWGWRDKEQFDLVATRMKQVRGYDLRLCDICDFFIAFINPKVASWGSAEEITTIIRAKKPLFLVIDDEKGKRACPLWLFGVMPHKYIYNNLDEVMQAIKGIDEGIIKPTSDRWKLLREEWR